jgi:hypothetical protein
MKRIEIGYNTIVGLTKEATISVRYTFGQNLTKHLIKDLVAQ